MPAWPLHYVPLWSISLTLHPFALPSQILGLLAQVALERDDLNLALAFAQRSVQVARDACATDTAARRYLLVALRAEADILESLGRLDDALAIDAEWQVLNTKTIYPEVLVRTAIKYMAAGEDADAEPLLRLCLTEPPTAKYELRTNKMFQAALRPYTVLAELLERRGTEEALAEARTLRDTVAQQLARHEEDIATLLEETRIAAAEAVRQSREERIKAKEKKEGGKGMGKKKGMKKGRRAKAEGKGASSAAAVEERPPGEPAGEQAEGAAAVERPAAAEAEQQAQVGESQLQEEDEDEEEEREVCAICLQDMEFDDDEDPGCDDEGEGEAVVMLRCGHRFHEICGDMWCSKCANNGCGVTCPRCRAPYVPVRR
jgi:tetratricopeptide (TPR) repeat protein